MSLSPSRRLTEFLSSYIDFNDDPKTAQGKAVQLGLWSGDLLLENVKLKASAIDPLLNATSPQKDGLQYKLLRGTIGRMKVQVGWSSLATGRAADVNVEINDVKIELGFESELEKHGASMARRGARMMS
eukprot:14701976-Ditylum_brightwellii.AAC.1